MGNGWLYPSLGRPVVGMRRRKEEDQRKTTSLATSVTLATRKIFAATGRYVFCGLEKAAEWDFACLCLLCIFLVCLRHCAWRGGR